MKDTKIVFMGTPDFSVPILEGLIENYNVIGVVTQPDKIVGKNKTTSFTAVKKCALEHNIKVFQPEKIKQDYENILNLNPDIIITCAYGQIIPDEILEYPKYKCINVHASLLPKLRGGAPIHHAIIDGYKKTGVTIMYMEEKMDAGNIISVVETKIEDTDNVGTLHDRLSLLGRDLLLETLPDILNNTNKSIKQNSDEVTYAWNIKREEEIIDFNKNTIEVFNHIRGLNPFPGAYSILDEKIIKIYNVKIGNTKSSVPGQIINIYKDGIGVSTKDGEIIVQTLKPFGKKLMGSRDYLNGIKDKKALIGKRFKTYEEVKRNL